VTYPYAPDLSELTESARTKPMTTAQRELALDRLADRRAELMDELAQLDAIERGHHQALTTERTYSAAMQDVMTLLDKWGYQPKQAHHCTDCHEPCDTGICRDCSEERRR
jgi:recombinational DNA repair protein RecR